MNSWDDTHPSEVSPVQQVRESLCAVALDYSLSTRLLAVWKHELSQLVTRLVRRTEPPVHNVDSYNTCRYNSITSCIRFSVLYQIWRVLITVNKRISCAHSFGKHWLIHSPYSEGSDTCSSMKQPNPDRLVVTLGMPMTVHSPEHITEDESYDAIYGAKNYIIKWDQRSHAVFGGMRSNNY